MTFLFSKPNSTKSSTRKILPSKTHLTHTPPTFFGTNCTVPTLEGEDRDSCEGKITEKERAEALKNMKKAHHRAVMA